MFKFCYIIIMKIYLEQILITNFIIDFCILLVISKLIFTHIKYRRIVFSALFGSFATLIYPFCTNFLLTNCLKIISAIIMLQILKPINKKQLMLSVLLMLGLSYAIGGAILSNFGSQTSSGYIITDTNLIFVFITTILTTFILCKLISWIKTKIITNSNIYEITLTNNNKSVIIKSFIDSGNSLYDNNDPVSLINFDTFTKLTNLNLNQYLTNQFNELKDPHFITANTISGKRKILVFTIDKLSFNQHAREYYKVKLGVALHFDNSKEYKAILNSSFCYN